MKKAALIVWKTPQEEMLLTETITYLKKVRNENIDKDKSILDAIDVILKVIIKEKNDIK